MLSQNIAVILTVILTLSTCKHDNKPNIVIMIADDLGIGDVGCFGNTTLPTPHIDSIAAEGVKLTHHLTAASVCTPSRAALMTGRYPIRMGMVPTNLIRVNVFTSSVSGLPASEVTFAELAKQQGYSTALIGKWHLGVHSKQFTKDFAYHPLNQGFDYYYGLPLTNLQDFGDDGEMVVTTDTPRFHEIIIASSLATVVFFVFLSRLGFLSRRLSVFLCLIILSIIIGLWWTWTHCKLLNSLLLRNHQLIEQPIKLAEITDRLVNEGQKFLEQRKEDQQPFLLVMSWLQVHTALHGTHFKGKSVHGPYGDEVMELDWSIGQILEQLQTLGFKNNTLVYLTSDNGGHIEEKGASGYRAGGYNGIYRGGKMQGGMDGGIRVPTVARWPGVITPGSRIDIPTSLMDITPTLADIWGATMPKDRTIDGVSILPLLKGQQTVAPPHKFMFHYCGSAIHAVRYIPSKDGVDVWKAHFMTPNWIPGTEGCGFRCSCYNDKVIQHSPPLIYNIGRDPGEKQICTSEKPCYPLTSAEQHSDIIDLIIQAKQEHIQGVDTTVTNQYAWHRLLPRPWLQMCCNFPSCSCSEF